MIRCPLIAALWMLTFFLATTPIHAAEPTAPSSPNDWKPGTIAEAQLKKQGFHPAYTEAEIFLENLIKNEDLFLYKSNDWIEVHGSDGITFFNENIDPLTYLTADMITSLKTTPIRPKTKSCPNHYAEPECGFPGRPIPCTDSSPFNFYKVIQQRGSKITIANMDLALYRMIKTPKGWRLDGFKCLPAQPYDIYPFSGISFNMPPKYHRDIR